MSLDFDPAAAERLLVLPSGFGALDLISDLHLSPDHPKTADRFAAYLADPGWQALVILGDLFEVWVGDDALTEAGFEQACAARLREATWHRPIWLMHGNRDFLVGERFAHDTGIRLLPDPSLLRAFDGAWLLTHGDALCLDDTDYQQFRRVVRDPAWQRELLARPLPERRAFASQARQASQTRKDGSQPAEWADVDVPAANRWLDVVAASHLIHGHTHRPGHSELAPGRMRHVLSDWDLDDAQRPRAEAIRLSPEGMRRIDLAFRVEG